MANFNSTFTALLKEAQFTKEILGAGATEIRRANYATKGKYFQAFTSLATGLERIGKLCLMLDHYVKTGGTFPDLKYLKNEIGHNLALLQQRAEHVIAERGMDIAVPSDPLHHAIIELLSTFAQGDRYSNINMLVSSNRQSDPIADWYTRVDMPLFDRHVTEKKKVKIKENARVIALQMDGSADVLNWAEEGSEITKVEEASYRTGVYEAVALYRQLYVLQIIRFWANFLVDLQGASQGIGKQEIPYFNELFNPYRNKDSILRGRKTWDSV